MLSYSQHSQEWGIICTHKSCSGRRRRVKQTAFSGCWWKAWEGSWRRHYRHCVFIVVDENSAQEPTDLEASSVKEAALDDKLGVELRSIVEQIQVASGHPGAPGAHPGAPERWDENSGGGRRWVWCEFATLLEWFQDQVLTWHTFTFFILSNSVLRICSGRLQMLWRTAEKSRFAWK